MHQPNQRHDRQGVTNIESWTFDTCTSLASVCFAGNAPSVMASAFADDKVIVYYLPGTAGWGPTFGGQPTVLWNPRVQTSDSTFGVRTNRFGFIITDNDNIPVVVEASTDLANPNWSPLATNTFSSGSAYFSDPQWTNYPTRFYRLRWP